MQELASFLLFGISMLVTPGPNNLLIMYSGLNFGVRKSLSHFWGICFGFSLMLFIVTLGFGAIFDQIEWLKHLLKILGSIYMLYLAWQIYSSKASKKKVEESKPFNFMQAALFQWVNVKAWMMCIGVVSLYTLTENFISNAFAISTIYFFICIPCLAVWLIGGALLQNLLKEEKQTHIFNTVMALSLVLSITLLFY